MNNTNGRAGVRRTMAEWRRILMDFEASGQTQAVFCAGRGVGLSTFCRWRHKLGVDGLEPRQNDGTAFVELARDRTVWAPGVLAAPSWDVELDLGGGTVLRVRRPSAC